MPLLNLPRTTLAGLVGLACAAALAPVSAAAQPQSSVSLAWARGSEALPPLAQASPNASGAQAGNAAPEGATPKNSILDDQLMYQLLVAEMALNQGDNNSAFELLLEAARRTGDEGLFRRSTDVALQARSGDRALVVTQAWRAAHPDSLDALRTQLQILLALNRAQDINDPLRLLLALSPEEERIGLIAALPRFLQRAGQAKDVALLMEAALKPHLAAAQTAVISRIALGRAWLAAGDTDKAWALAQEAYAQAKLAPPQSATSSEPTNPVNALNSGAKNPENNPVISPSNSAAGAAFLALALMSQKPQSETLVLDHLSTTTALPAVRLSYVRALTNAQRYADAVAQLQKLTEQQPDVAPPFLTLGALQIELKQPALAEAALNRYLALTTAAEGNQPNQPTAAPGRPPQADDEDDEAERGDRGRIQAWLMLSQVAEQRGDFATAEAWLARITDPDSALDVQTRRATIMARQGRIQQAREAIRSLPEKKPADARAKMLAETSMLREAKRWADAYDVLGATQKRFGEDADLSYEQAMMAEKASRPEAMEKLLRRVIELKPDNANAHNALGYALADRKVRLPEAQKLIERALELAPGDPFITDSLGWVQFRRGNLPEALRHLQTAWKARPDTEIGAHLGEVLWSMGQKDEARRIWREAKSRDASNDVLRETLSRLRVDL